MPLSPSPLLCFKSELDWIDKKAQKEFGKLKKLTKNEDCQVVWEEHKQPHCSTTYENVRIFKNIYFISVGLIVELIFI